MGSEADAQNAINQLHGKPLEGPSIDRQRSSSTRRTFGRRWRVMVGVEEDTAAVGVDIVVVAAAVRVVVAVEVADAAAVVEAVAANGVTKLSLAL